MQFQVTDAIKSVKASVEYSIIFNFTYPKKYSPPIAQRILHLRLFVMISFKLGLIGYVTPFSVIAPLILSLLPNRGEGN